MTDITKTSTRCGRGRPMKCDIVQRLRDWADTICTLNNHVPLSSKAKMAIDAAGEIERLRAELAAAIKERNEARLEARFVDSRHPFIGGPLDGSMIDTDAAIYEMDGERYYRSWYMVAVTTPEDDRAFVLAKAKVYFHATEEGRSLTTAELQRLRFVEYRRVGPLKGKG